MKKNAWDDYGKWLLWRVGFFDKGYSKLMKILHGTHFFFLLEMDENRSLDGVYLRGEYFDDIGLEEGLFSEDCSVLEMLVALALRMNDEYLGDPKDPRPGDIFMELIRNLGLGKYDNSRLYPSSMSEIQLILDRWMNRDFKRNGEGSIFPLKKSKKDQRKIEIWEQMQAYISENY